MSSQLDALRESLSAMDKEKPYFKALIYGPSGVGKTVLAATAGKNFLLVDSNDGWVSLINHPELRSNGTRMPYEGLSQIEAICDAVEKQEAPFNGFDTIIIDEASTISVLDLDVVLASRSKKDPSKDPNIATLPDFGANTERCRRAFNRLLSLPVNVILTAHVREDKDDRTGTMYIRSSFTPKLRQNILRLVHICGHLTMNEETNKDGETVFVRKLQLTPSRNIEAKSRLELPSFIENPDLGVIISDWVDSDGVEVITETEPLELEEELSASETPTNESVDTGTLEL